MQKAKALASKAKDAAEKGAAAVNKVRAERTDGLLDERVQAKHTLLMALQKAHMELASTLKHEAERGHKSAKTTKETRDALAHLVEVDPAMRTRLAPSQAAEAALNQCWEEFATAIEKDLLAPVKQLGALFTEADKLYSSYVNLVNDLAAKQSKEKRVHGLASMVNRGDDDKIADKTEAAHQQVEEMVQRKQLAEVQGIERLAELHDSATEALSFLCERHAALHAAHLKTALAKCSAPGTPPVETWEEWRQATNLGWIERANVRAVQSVQAGAKKQGSQAKLAVDPGGLEVLVAQDDAVGGVPLVAHLLMARIRGGHVGVRQNEQPPDGAKRMYEAEGLFRISGEAEEVNEMRSALMSDGGRAAAAVAACTDPHVLAASLKQFYRKLPTPLIPAASYEPLLRLGQQLEGDGDAEAGALGEVSELLRDIPEPNVGNMQALFAFLSEVAAYKEINRMDTANLAIVFAPNIARPDTPSPNELAEVPIVAAAISACIRHQGSCFPAPEYRVTAAAYSSPGAGPGLAAAASYGCVDGSPPTEDGRGGDEESEEEAEWWYSLEGEQVGPVTSAELALMVQDGTLHMGTFVYEDGADDWTELRNVASKLPATV